MKHLQFDVRPFAAALHDGLALAAAFLGATSIRPGRFNVVGTLLAIFFLATAITGLTFAGVQSFINDLFTGTALVLAVAISAVLRRRRTLS